MRPWNQKRVKRQSSKSLQSAISLLEMGMDRRCWGGGVGGRRRGNEDAEENEKEGDGGGGTYFL
jgi:hypothetical protein